jgi:hypothetical protein
MTNGKQDKTLRNQAGRKGAMSKINRRGENERNMPGCWRESAANRSDQFSSRSSQAFHVIFFQVIDLMLCIFLSFWLCHLLILCEILFSLFEKEAFPFSFSLSFSFAFVFLISTHQLPQPLVFACPLLFSLLELAKENREDELRTVLALSTSAPSLQFDRDGYSIFHYLADFDDPSDILIALKAISSFDLNYQAPSVCPLFPHLS